MSDHDSQMMREIFHKQKASLSQLETAVNGLIKMSSQMTAGQVRDDNKGHIPYQFLDIYKWTVICEAVALVCDKEVWNKLKEVVKE